MAPTVYIAADEDAAWRITEAALLGLPTPLDQETDQPIASS
jgi:hypothetical protein